MACSGSKDRLAFPVDHVPSALVTRANADTECLGEGFCGDRRVIGDVYDLVRAGTVPYRQAAASVVAAGKVMRADVSLAGNGPGARKLRQFVLYLNTLRLGDPRIGRRTIRTTSR